MARWFLDRSRPLATCTGGPCSACPLQTRLQCHFGGQELLRFLVIAFPPFVVGGMGIAGVNAWYLIPWIAVCLAFFGLVEIRVMCSHCPHYGEPGTTSLRCWANYGSPKPWKYRPGPMSGVERAVFFGGLGLIAGYPLAFLLIGAQWLLLAVFALLVVGMAGACQTWMCRRCMNFACPFNAVEPAARAAFLARNPSVAQAWKGAPVQ